MALSRKDHKRPILPMLGCCWPSSDLWSAMEFRSPNSYFKARQKQNLFGPSGGRITAKRGCRDRSASLRIFSRFCQDFATPLCLE
jgi:hypothetical protein